MPGISAVTAHTILCEIGPHLSAFRNASAFASWLGLCPEKQISGGKVLFTRVVEFEVGSHLHCGWQQIHCTTPTTTSANSSDVWPENWANHLRSLLPLTNWLALCFIF